MHIRKPEIIVFAGPNGSGKSSVTKAARVIGKYINADEIKKELGCSDIEAATIADEYRDDELNAGRDFTFETVLSTEKKLEFLKRAKKNGYFIRCIYVITKDPNINVYRVVSRMETGGHGVPADKVVSRYGRCIKLLPEIFELADTFYLYDNSDELVRIAVKKRNKLELTENENWAEDEIKKLIWRTHKG